MFCQLGAHVFQLAKTPNSISHREEFTFAEFALINQANRLQPTGRGLRQYTFGIYLNVEFVKVDDEIKAIRESARNFEVLPLLWGNGKVEGDFVILSIDTETRQTDDLGNIYAASLQLELKEYIADPAKKQQQQATKQAFATGTKKNVVGKTATAKQTPVVQQPCNKNVADLRQQLNMIKTSMYTHHAHKDALINESFAQTNAIEQGIAKELVDLRYLCNRCTKKTNDFFANHADCMNANNLQPKILDIQVATSNLYDFYNSDAATRPGQIATGNNYINKWGLLVLDFVNSTSALAAAAITRQP